MEQLQSALAVIKVVRTTVGQIFETLGGGICIENGEQRDNKKFLRGLQALLTAAHTNLRNLDLSLNSLVLPPTSLPLGKTTFLQQENSQERQALYRQLVNSYLWFDKSQEFGSMAVSILTANPLQRSTFSTTRRRPFTATHNILPRDVDSVLREIQQSLRDITIFIARPYSANAVVYVTLGRVLKAALIFKGIMIEWVTVKGFAESFDSDLWAESRHQVFRKVQDHTHAAMLHFQSPTMPIKAVDLFMKWFHSYLKLFSAPCKKCGKHLLHSQLPTWRDYGTSDPFHEECN